jgi:hypothetical protein
MFQKYPSDEEVRLKTGCDGFFFVKKSKEGQLFCNRQCQKNYNAYIKEARNLEEIV